MTKSKTTWTRPAPDSTPALNKVPGVRPTAPRLCIEVIDKGTGCAACHYMDAAVTQVLTCVPDGVDYRRVNLRTPAGKARFLELCVALYGHEEVHRHLKLAPVPALFMNGRLVFTTIPDEGELRGAINRLMPSAS